MENNGLKTAATSPKSDRATPQGPISQRLSAGCYLEDKKIPQIFESLLAGLMLECPDDHMTYLNGKLDSIQEMGADNVAWDTFIAHLRPNKVPVPQSSFDLLVAEQDPQILECSESLEQTGMYGSSRLFKLTDPTPTNTGTADRK